MIACPECDKTPVVVNSTSARNSGTFSKYRCPTCSAQFDEPKVREDRGGPGIPDNTLAAKLDKADPGDLVTDGGVDQSDTNVSHVDVGDSPPIYLEVGDGFNSQDFHLSYEAANSLAVQLTETIPHGEKEALMVDD